MVLQSEESSQTSGSVTSKCFNAPDEKKLKRINFDVTLQEFYNVQIYAALHRTKVTSIFREYIAKISAEVEALKTPKMP